MANSSILILEELKEFADFILEDFIVSIRKGFDSSEEVPEEGSNSIFHPSIHG